LQAPAVVKPELDVRGIAQLELRSLALEGNPAAMQVCGNWANAALIGQEGARAEFVASAPSAKKKQKNAK